jgi:hypothetical protein
MTLKMRSKVSKILIQSVGLSVPLFPMIIPLKIVFLVIVLLTIVAVGMAVALFFFMLIKVHLRMGLSWNS